MVSQPPSFSGSLYDVAIIGAGVVGCATARSFSIAGAKVVVLEKGSDILSGASKANSAILHTGFDAPPNSLELSFVRAGRQEYLRIHKSLNLPLLKTGALVCAWSRKEADRLQEIAECGVRNGVTPIRLLSAGEARQIESGLSDKLVAALHVPDEYVIDPWSAPLAYLSQAVTLGAEFYRLCEVVSGEFNGEWNLHTSSGQIRARWVVNAAGLFGDQVDMALGFPADFRIRPRKGQFVVFDKVASKQLRTIILPVPSEITKGIVVCPTAFGNILVGPTAEEQEDRLRATVDHDTLESLVAHAAKLLPPLGSVAVTAVYAGLRPATEKKEYRILFRPDRNAITLGGIRSTGLSSALGLAQHALALHAGAGHTPLNARDEPLITMPNLAEAHPRDWQADDHGEIVCHCEMVTRREIVAAMNSPVAPGDFGGLKRRTRAGMGRCQGFYCHARLAEMTKDLLTAPLAFDQEEVS